MKNHFAFISTPLLTALLISPLTLSGAASADDLVSRHCPNLSGRFQCPKYGSQPPYILHVSQAPFPGGMAYSHFFSFAASLETTTASPYGRGVGGICRNQRLIIDETHNIIAANGNYQALVGGKVVIECRRIVDEPSVKTSIRR